MLPSYDNWAGCIVKRYSHCSLASPTLSSGMRGLNSIGLRVTMDGQLLKVCNGLQASRRTAPSNRAKLLHILSMVPASQSLGNSAILSFSTHFQAAAADAFPHGVSCFASGTGKAC